MSSYILCHISPQMSSLEASAFIMIIENGNVWDIKVSSKFLMSTQLLAFIYTKFCILNVSWTLDLFLEIDIIMIDQVRYVLLYNVHDL